MKFSKLGMYRSYGFIIHTIVILLSLKLFVESTIAKKIVLNVWSFGYFLILFILGVVEIKRENTYSTRRKGVSQAFVMPHGKRYFLQEASLFAILAALMLAYTLTV